MYSLRRTACRLFSLPTPLRVRSKPATVSSPHHHIISCRPISHSRWLKGEGRSKSGSSGVSSAAKATSAAKTTTVTAPTPDTADTVEETLTDERTLGFDVDPMQIREAAAEETKAERQRLEDAHWDGFRKTQARPKSTIFIGNLFYDVTAEDLKKHMAKFGVVQAVNIIYDSRGISKGFGYVQFDRWQSAKMAIDAMDMKIYQGRRVTVYYAHSSIVVNKEYIPPTKVLYIGNVPFAMTDRDLNDLFTDIVNVIDVRVSMDRRTGQFQGYLHAEFTDTQSAVVGLEKLSSKRPYGRRMRVSFSNNIRTSQGTKLAMENAWFDV
ncbi:hypothetical protein BJX64DRAFT_252830 [Aspergillus heterothallicus]